MGSNFQNLKVKKMKKSTLKKLLIFQEFKFSKPKFKKPLFFLFLLCFIFYVFFRSTPQGFFITVSWDVFISPLFYYCFRVIFIVDCICSIYCFFNCFYFTTEFTIVFRGLSFQLSLPWPFFVRYFVFLLLYHEFYGSERALFTLWHFLPSIPSRNLAPPAFIKAYLGPAVLPWRLQGVPLRFQTHTRPICLFESHSVQQKVIVGRFY